MLERIVFTIRSAFFRFRARYFIVTFGSRNYCMEGIIISDSHFCILVISPSSGAIPLAGNINMAALRFCGQGFFVVPQSPVTPISGIWEILNQAAPVGIANSCHPCYW
jgi:hypothetical protein